MGLDMYAYYVKKSINNTDFSYGEEQDKNISSYKNIADDYYRVEDFYWRKNRHLHNWIKDFVWNIKCKKYNVYTPHANDFNCQMIRLSEYDLLRLRYAIINNILSECGGFFFGNNEYTEHYRSEDLRFVNEAIEMIHQGYDIYYYPSW